MSDDASVRIARRATRARAREPSAREYLAFEVGAEHYALPLPCVREIVRVPAVTEVPRAPSHVLGVISVRGAVTTVFDLRIKLRLRGGAGHAARAASCSSTAAARSSACWSTACCRSIA